MPSEQELLKVIKLNVGGRSFSSTYSTLKRSPTIQGLISNDKKPLVGSDEIFIDRSGYHFGFILQYLRGDNPNFKSNKDIRALKMEAKFYQLFELVENIDAFWIKSVTGATYKLMDPAEVFALICKSKEATTKIHFFPSKIKVLGAIRTREPNSWCCTFHKQDNYFCCPKSCTAILNTMKITTAIKYLVELK